MSSARLPPNPARDARRRLKRSSLVGGALSYESGVRIQRFLLSLGWVQRLFFSRPVQLIRRWAEICSIPDPSDVILGSLMTNTWRGWRMKSVRHPAVAEKWVRVEGLEHLRRALEGGRGVVALTLHTLRTGLIQHAVRMVTDKQVHFFAGRVDEELEENIVMATYVRRIIDSQTSLENGEIVIISGDGLRGNAAHPQPFFGRIFPFRTGFAELAVRSNAAALAVFIYYHTDGVITLEFSELIHSEAGDRETRLKEMVEQYARLVEERWPRLIASLPWRKLRQVLAMPPVSG